MKIKAIDRLKKILKEVYGVEVNNASPHAVMWALAKIENPAHQEAARKAYNRLGLAYIYN